MKTLLLFACFLLITSSVEARPFAPAKSNYKSNAYKKYKPSRKTDAFVCVRHKKVNRKGLTR